MHVPGIDWPRGRLAVVFPALVAEKGFSAGTLVMTAVASLSDNHNARSRIWPAGIWICPPLALLSTTAGQSLLCSSNVTIAGTVMMYHCKQCAEQ